MQRTALSCVAITALCVTALVGLSCSRTDPAFLQRELDLSQELNRKGDLAGALACLQRVLETKPSEHDLEPYQATPEHLWRLAGQDHYYIGDFDKAEDFEGVIEINPKSYEAHFMLGEIHRDQEVWHEARREYELAFQLSKEDAQAGINLVLPQSRMFKAERVNMAANQRLRELPPTE